MSVPARKTFDYSIVDQETKSDLIYYAGEITKRNNLIGNAVIEMGEFLSAAQNRLSNHSSGVFVQWVEMTCGFGKSTAYRMINSFEAFGSFPNLGKLEDSAMYALSSPGTPEKARKEAMKLANKGESISHAKAQEIIAKYKEKSSDRGPVESARPRTEKGGGNRSQTGETAPADSVSQTEGYFNAIRGRDGEDGRRDADGTDASGDSAETPRNGTEPTEGPADSCPVCAGTKWTWGLDESWHCFKCGHPHGEPAGEPDEDRIATQRSKTVKTAEALLRAFDDLQHICPKTDSHSVAIERTKQVLKIARGWK